MGEFSNKKRVRDDSDESEFDSAEVKRLRDDLLYNLDYSDLSATTPDLDSFMKSFEEEISACSPPHHLVAVVDLTSEAGESQPELGYLLEASDDELGLPPSATTTSSCEVGNNEESELVRVSSESSAEFGELWRFDDQISSFDSLEYVVAGSDENVEYVALDGLFDYTDLGYESYDPPLWRPESASALL